MCSDDVELTDGRLLLATVLIKPLPVGRCGQDGTILGHASVRLRGPEVGGVPVFIGNARSGLVRPLAFGYHVVDAQPHLLVLPQAQADVVPELVVFCAGHGRTEDSAQRVAVLAGRVVALLHHIDQEALVVDFNAFQTN